MPLVPPVISAVLLCKRDMMKFLLFAFWPRCRLAVFSNPLLEANMAFFLRSD
jgi:hypothetical protein